MISHVDRYGATGEIPIGFVTSEEEAKLFCKQMNEKEADRSFYYDWEPIDNLLGD